MFDTGRLFSVSELIRPVYTIKVFHQKLGESCWRKICSTKTLSKLTCLHDQSLIKVFIPSYLSAVNSKTNKMAEWSSFRKDVLIGQFPSKSIKIFRKIWWVSIQPKSIKVLWPSFWSCKLVFSLLILTLSLSKIKGNMYSWNIIYWYVFLHHSIYKNKSFQCFFSILFCTFLPIVYL
jgi:hypothetical protein